MTPEEFRAIRNKLELTQEQLARVLDFQRGLRVSELERGAVKIGPRIDMLMQALKTGWRPKGYAQLIEGRKTHDA